MESKKQVKIYKGVEDSVKKASAEEPKIATDSIVKAFASFGMKAPEHELLYWSNQPTSKASKMLEELKKSKKEKTEKFKENYQKVMTMAPLSNKEIYAVYDEYGLEKPNPDWVRKNLPNDEEKLRKYLDIERDFKNKSYKKDLSNKLKAEQMVQPAGGMVQQMGMMDGVGAANVLSDTAGNEDEEVVPYHLSGLSLCRVNGDNTIWLIDSSKGTIKPFTSRKAFVNFFKGKNDNFDRVADAQDAIKDISVKQFNSLMKKYKLSSNKYGIKEDGQGGSGEDAFYVNTNDLSNNYGSTINENTLDKSISFVLAFLELYYNAGALSYQTYNKIKSDGDLMGLYAEAFTTGGYNAEDIYRDVKSRELKSNGSIDSNLSGIDVISPTIKKDEYQNTQEYKLATQSPQLEVPSSIKTNYSSDYLSLPLYNLPDNAFEVISPITDPTSEEFKTAASEIKTTYNDILKMKLEAETEAQRDYAEKVWQDFRSDLERSYGIKLSNNASDAWNSINSYFNTAAASGLMNSGIMNEAVDSYLNKVRDNNDQLRYSKLQESEKKEAEYYRTSASPEEINALSQEKKEKYGLVPSDSIKNEFSTASLKAKFPDLTDEEIKKYQSKIFDENGNFRSEKYATLSGNLATVDENSASLREQAVFQKAADKEQKARDEMSFTSGKKTTSTVSTTNPVDTTTENDSTTQPVSGSAYEQYKAMNPEQQKGTLTEIIERLKTNSANNQESSAPTTTTNVPSPSTSSLVISRNLSPGSSGEDVKQLQSWLISQGYNIDAGATGYFGEQTKSAVANWQKANNIDTAGNYGYFGPISRNYVSTQGTSSAKAPVVTSGANIPVNSTNTSTAPKNDYTEASKAASNISNSYTQEKPVQNTSTSTTSVTPVNNNTTTNSSSLAPGYNAVNEYGSMSEEQKRKTLLDIISRLQNNGK